ncbi:helicase [Pelobacter propionicus]|uniref:Helicase, putative n=1 Tax=Pelobacter propionicus (strain DSM 2379 / NBRC 103807 / OttBd1) TaxID=338966 RepID=A1AMQ7_PELPD|nr:helicase [Pelobacter propionicus]ABK98627.1 helicase, putative [Pelobacter propionicus DSM 2379]
MLEIVEAGSQGVGLSGGQKKRNNVTVPFTYLGSVDMVSFESERPIKMVWQLRYAMPVEMFEDNRRVG